MHFTIYSDALVNYQGPNGKRLALFPILSIHPSILLYFSSTFAVLTLFRWIFQKPKIRFVQERSAANTPSTRWPSTKQESHHFLLKESDVTMLNKRVMVVKLNLFWNAKPRQPKRLFFVWNALNANTEYKKFWKDANILNWVEKRSLRMLLHHTNSK